MREEPIPVRMKALPPLEEVAAMTNETREGHIHPQPLARMKN